MDSVEILKKHKCKYGNEEFTTGGFVAFLICAFIIAGVTILYFTADPLKTRVVNRYELYNNKTKQVMQLSEIISKSKEYEGIPYDYSAELQNSNITISGSIPVEKIEQDKDNKLYSVTGQTDFNSMPDSPSLKIVVWIDKIPDMSKYTIGAPFKFKGRVYGINKDWIIINFGEVVK